MSMNTKDCAQNWVAETNTVTAARERVRSAEESELRAEKALEQAKRDVREAKDHAARLEREAQDEYAVSSPRLCIM